MSPRSALPRRRGRRVCGTLAAAAAAVSFALLGGLPGSAAVSTAGGQQGSEEVTPQTDASVPVRSLTMIGASPSEAPGETWGIGQENGASVVVRYSDEDGWSLASGLLDHSGQPLSGFQLAHPEGFKNAHPSPLAGEMTGDGSGVLAGTIPDTTPPDDLQQVVLVREPGGDFQETAPVPETMLTKGESLFGLNRAPMIAALEEEGEKRSGALVVPVDESGSVEEDVLHWNGTAWTREQIELPEPVKKEKEEGRQVEFQVLAVAASSPKNAWLLARFSPAGAVALFRRGLEKGGEPATWQSVALKSGGTPGEPLTVELKPGGAHVPFTVSSTVQSQALTVTSEGVWMDGLRSDVQASTTMFFKPEGEAGGHISGTWCNIPEGAPTGTESCENSLPEALPTGPSRSFAWPGGGFGERVITGLPNGVSLRLEGDEFKRVLALGGSTPPEDVGGTFGAAFSSAKEGWLGQEELPVHLTLKPVASALAPWPVAFRYALLALAPQPGAPVGALSSEALAVGDNGEVARFKPEVGWLPETLPGPGGRRETPRLRAVAWPTPTHAYAVGDEGEMWLWRGETGLWEPDPAAPPNFRGNLLGIAFDPNEPSRGYAVGQDGVLLSYGKTWTQEPAGSLPAAVEGASFTSIAFAGSEAIVAYRKLVTPGQDHYVGGLIVNNGSGWEIDQGAAAAMGSNVPWAVAGLPDGGAAFSASGTGEGSTVYERESASSAWQATPTRYPGGGAPGALAIFREGGAVRVIGSGAEPNTFSVEEEASPPAGFPPNEPPPFPLTSDPGKGVLRQTATGWSDEEHELNDVKEPPGEYEFYDTVYQPDPVAAVLVDPTGSLGWAVGGFVEGRHPLLDTADVYRYPAGGPQPLGVGSAPVANEVEERRKTAHEGPASAEATFAIGGGAQCAAPCADQANAKIGPDMWLKSAVASAGEISGVRAFLYTGARVTTGQTAGPEMLPYSHLRELERYRAVLHSGTEAAYAVASPTDLDNTKSEGVFEQVFGEFPFVNRECAIAGCQGAYYSLESTGEGGSVRVIMLDNTAAVSSTQLEWLEAELRSAVASSEPAIVVGHADLSAEIAAGEGAASNVAQVLAHDGASAYFFDSPERNIELPLQVGSSSIPTFGSGTLGYVSFTQEEQGNFTGDSGFLLAHIGKHKEGTNVVQVKVELIPNLEELSMEAEEGTLLRRSQAALFTGLARRPRSGNIAHNQSNETRTSPYIPITSVCVASACNNGLLPQFTFSSSKPEYGEFVEPNSQSSDPLAVLLGANGEPIPDEHSGLFCALNAGTTIVTISAGGRSFRMPVTIQAGSVRQPCGTTHLNGLPLKSQTATAPVAPAPAPAPAGPAPASAPAPLPLLPPPPVLAPRPPLAPKPTVPPPFFVVPPPPVFVPAFVPLPVPTPARPTPPSGTSAVTSPVEAPEREEEKEAAPESVSNEAVAYRAPEHEPSPAYLLGVVLLAAFAGASLRGRPGRRGNRARVAPATVSTMRAQRRMAQGREWRR